MSKKVTSAAVAAFVAGLMTISVVRAETSQMVTVRAGDGSLWKLTCDGETCSSFASFPGNLDSQPTVLWDENLERYVIWGRSSDGGIWRATFMRDGTFNNDWTNIPGNTASPLGGVGADVSYDFNSLDTSNVSQKVFAHSGGCNGNAATETQTFVRVPAGSDTIVTRTDIRRDGGNVQCQCNVQKFLQTSTANYWTQHDVYNAACGALQQSRVFDKPIPRRTSSMKIGKSFGQAATTSPAAGTIVEQTTLLGIENITVPAGTYNNCLRIHTSRARSWSGAGQLIDWVCPSVGLAKRIMTQYDGSSFTWDLTSVTFSP